MNQQIERESVETYVPFGGIEAKAEKGESELEDPLGSYGGGAGDRHDEAAEGKREMKWVWGFMEKGSITVC